MSFGGSRRAALAALCVTFLVLVAAMTLNAFALYAVVINLVPLLTGRGLSSSAAAWALGLDGIGQVIGRLGYRSLAAHTGVRARSLVVISTGAVTTLLLALLPAHTAPLLAAAVAAGAARGLFTLFTATIVADHWGSERTGWRRRKGTRAAAISAGWVVASEWSAPGMTTSSACGS